MSIFKNYSTSNHLDLGYSTAIVDHDREILCPDCDAGFGARMDFNPNPKCKTCNDVGSIFIIEKKNAAS